MGEVAGVVYRLIVDLDDHVAGMETGLLCAASFLYCAHQHAIAILDAEEVSKLRRDVLHHQPAARRGSYYNHVHRRDIDIGDVNGGNVYMDVARFRTRPVV